MEKFSYELRMTPTVGFDGTLPNDQIDPEASDLVRLNKNVCGCTI